MKEAINSLKCESYGAGHFVVSCSYSGETLSAITLDEMAVEAAFDDSYDKDPVNACRFYPSSQKAKEELVDIILKSNNKSDRYEFI